MSHPLDNYCEMCRSIYCVCEEPKKFTCRDCGRKRFNYAHPCICFICSSKERYEEELQKQAISSFDTQERIFITNLCKKLAEKGILTREETIDLFKR